MFKFEMTIGWLGNGTVTVETSDFDVIESLKEFKASFEMAAQKEKEEIEEAEGAEEAEEKVEVEGGG